MGYCDNESKLKVRCPFVLSSAVNISDTNGDLAPAKPSLQPLRDMSSKTQQKQEAQCYAPRRLAWEATHQTVSFRFGLVGGIRPHISVDGARVGQPLGLPAGNDGPASRIRFDLHNAQKTKG